MAETKTRKCRRCKERLPLDQYGVAPSGNPERVCLACKELELEYRGIRQGVATDWAEKMAKATRTYVKKEGLGETPFTTNELRGLREAQHDKCAVTGMDMVFAPHSFLTRREWYEQECPRDQQLRAVALVRHDPKRPWRVGNIYLVCRGIRDVRDWIGGDYAADLRVILDTYSQAPELPDPSEVDRYATYIKAARRLQQRDSRKQSRDKEEK